jgi:hypothetical protein
MEETLKLIAQYGFPIVVAAYLLVRMEAKLDLLTKSIDNMSKVLEVISKR